TRHGETIDERADSWRGEKTPEGATFGIRDRVTRHRLVDHDVSRIDAIPKHATEEDRVVNGWGTAATGHSLHEGTRSEDWSVRFRGIGPFLRGYAARRNQHESRGCGGHARYFARVTIVAPHDFGRQGG